MFARADNGDDKHDGHDHVEEDEVVMGECHYRYIGLVKLCVVVYEIKRPQRYIQHESVKNNHEDGT